MKPDAPPALVDEVRATLRIDAVPAGKRFQGVWLELTTTDTGRWVIDYRATEIWRGFENEQVIVTGHRYEPFGQAINARHFRVATMRFARPPSRAVPYRSIGPQHVLRGAFVEQVWPPGSRAGEVERSFRTDEGDTYAVAQGPTEAGPVAISARIVERDPTYAAGTSGLVLVVLRLHPHDWTPEPNP